MLSNGEVFRGTSSGILGTVIGEICFNTGLTGYQEVYTDPSYAGQILVSNNVHIGNYGIKKDESQSHNATISGLITKTYSTFHSRSIATESLHDFMTRNRVVFLEGIDTRALVSMIRDEGAMNCVLSNEGKTLDELWEKLSECPKMEGLDLSKTISTKESYEYGDVTLAKRIAILDFGVKSSIIQCIVNEGSFVKIFPADVTVSDLNEFSPSAYFLSNGPGDPASMSYSIGLVKNILSENKPIFGICLGHQLLALAKGVRTYKMHHGHRGQNHPVKNLITGYCEITTQNHGFAIEKESFMQKNDLELTHVNLNDHTIEGFKVKNTNVFGVQYHPEASPGPNDSKYLFKQFSESIEG